VPNQIAAAKERGNQRSPEINLFRLILLGGDWVVAKFNAANQSARQLSKILNRQTV
jgi:hypothetical protein